LVFSFFSFVAIFEESIERIREWVPPLELLSLLLPSRWTMRVGFLFGGFPLKPTAEIGVRRGDGLDESGGEDALVVFLMGRPSTECEGK
jgi:hypothetical protein